MATRACPRCSAPHVGDITDPLARCAWCGTLLASDAWPADAMVARAHLDPRRARLAVTRKIAQAGRTWTAEQAHLVYYPFAVTGNPRRPYRPLTDLPPSLAGGWRPSGTDLLREDEAHSEKDMPAFVLTAARVPIRDPLPPQTSVVRYPFFRVALRSEGRDSAAWCDAVDGQVVLPEDLLLEDLRVEDRNLTRQAWIAGAIGAGGGLLLPFPFSLIPSTVAGIVLWRKAAT